MQALGLLDHLRHGGADHRRDALACCPRTGRQAVLQSAAHGGGQVAVRLRSLVLKVRLARQQLLVELLAALLSARRQGLQLRHGQRQCARLGLQGLCGLAQAAVQALGLLDHLRHGGADHGRDALACRAGAFGQAVLQRTAHRAGQGAVRLGGLLLKVRLARQQLLVQVLAALLSACCQGLQLRHGLRQRAGLGLQSLCGLAQAAVQALRLLDHLRHGSADHGRDALACRAGAFGEAVLQRAAHRGGQGAVGLRSLVLKVRLAGQQLLVQVLVALLYAFEQELHLREHLRQRAGLGLQGLQRGLALKGR